MLLDAALPVRERWAHRTCLALARLPMPAHAHAPGCPLRDPFQEAWGERGHPLSAGLPASRPRASAGHILVLYQQGVLR